VFAPFEQSTPYFGDAAKQWMINFRVTDLDAMMAQLSAAGISVTADPQRYPNGRFAACTIRKAIRSNCGSPSRRRRRPLCE